MCASVSDLYGSNFGLSAEQLFQKNQAESSKCIDNNQKYQQNLKQEQIAGTADYTNKNTATIPPNVPQVAQNNTIYAKRPAWTDTQNIWPSYQNFSMFNRFQNEHYSSSDHIISLLQEMLLILKVIMLVLVLLFVIKIFDKK